jgi:RNA polymerase sigma factor (sigma-70 family)
MIDDALAAWEAAYRSHYRVLFAVAVQRFHIPLADAEWLVHDVLVAYVQSTRTIEDLRRWLVGAICNASKNYWRSHKREESLSPSALSIPDPRATVDVFDSAIAAHEALDDIHGKYRTAVQLRYIEGCTIPEIAAKLGTTSRYAEKLVHIGMQRLKKRGEK